MVKNLFSLLYSRQTSILSAAAVIMVTTVLSKILGLIRNRLLFHYFHPDSADIFFAALQLPDLIFQLIIFGALSVAFIPIFTEYFEKKGKDEAFAMAQSLLNLSLLSFFIISVAIYIFADSIISLMFGGFTPQKQVEVVNLTRIMLLGQIILTVGLFFVGIAHSFQRFVIPAFAGVFYNIGIILGTVLLSNTMGIKAPAIGVVVGAILHVLIQYPLVKSLGFKFSLKLFHSGIKEVITLNSIRSLGLIAEQIGEKVALGLSSFLQSGSLTYLSISQTLQAVPISLFAVSLAQAAFPVLSMEGAKGKIEEFKITLITTVHQILFLALPASAILIVLRIPAVRIAFGAAKFPWEATVLTGMTVAFLAVGLAAQSASLLFVRGFYALKDTKTPVIISLITVAVSVILSFYFVRVLVLEVWSLGLTFSISSILSALLLFIALDRKVGGFDKNQVFGPLLKMLMATITMGVALYVPIKLLDQVIFDTTRTINLIILTGIASIFALSVYIFLVYFLKVRELQTYADLIRRVAKFQTKLKSEEIITPETGTV